MTGNEMIQFMESSIRPGRARAGEPDTDSNFQISPESKSNAEDENEQVDISITRDPPYRFSAGCGTPVTFKETIGIHNPYGIEGVNTWVNRDGAESFLRSLDSHFDVNFKGAGSRYASGTQVGTVKE